MPRHRKSGLLEAPPTQGADRHLPLNIATFRACQPTARRSVDNSPPTPPRRGARTTDHHQRVDRRQAARLCGIPATATESAPSLRLQGCGPRQATVRPPARPRARQTPASPGTPVRQPNLCANSIGNIAMQRFVVATTRSALCFNNHRRPSATSGRSLGGVRGSVRIMCVDPERCRNRDREQQPAQRRSGELQRHRLRREQPAVGALQQVVLDGRLDQRLAHRPRHVLGGADEERQAVQERDVRAVEGGESRHQPALDPQGRQEETSAVVAVGGRACR